MQDDYDFGDSLCTTGVLDNLENMEAYNTNTSPPAPQLSTAHQDCSETAAQQHSVEISKDQPSKCNPSGLRRSPRIRQQELKGWKDVPMGKCENETAHDNTRNKNELKDDSFTSKGNEATEALDTMELNESIFQQLQLSEPKVESSASHLKLGLQNPSSDIKSFQSVHKSEHLSEDKYVKDSIFSSIIRRNVTKNSSVNSFPAHAPECEADSGGNVCEKKESSDKRQIVKEKECGGRILRSAKMRCTEPSQHNNEERDPQETKVSTGKHLKYLNRDTSNRSQNKENIENIKGSIEINVSPPKISANNVKSYSTLLESRQKVLSLTSASSTNCPKIPTSLGLPTHSSAMESSKKMCDVPDVGVSGQRGNTETDTEGKSSLNFRILVNEEVAKKQDDIPANFHSPQNIRENTGNIVVKSPLNSTDSQNILSTQEKMELSAWGLPDAVLKVMWDR